MKQSNLLVIISDEHRRDAMGCAGHPVVKTPNLDHLAASGTMFHNAYTASPMCVPTRAALACGDYVHKIHHWDSATPYDGSRTSWMHRLRDNGINVASIGKLHFRSGEDDNGFSEEILPMHVVGGVGWAAGLLRENPPDYYLARELAEQTGRGESSYTEYDRQITAAAIDWLSAPDRQRQPWAGFVSLVSPHYPLMAPPNFYDLYDPKKMVPNNLPRPKHPELVNIMKFFDYDSHFDVKRRQEAMAAYYGLTSFMDDCVGQILNALDASGQREETVVIYLSDHGEMLGDQGIWTKQVMYEASAGIPLIASGPGIAAGQHCHTATSILDIAMTACEVTSTEPDPNWPGASLIATARAPDDPDRVVMSEYHDGGSSTASFMIRWQNWKYVHYVGLPEQLFDLAADPDEIHDLADDTTPRIQEALAIGRQHLMNICDPDEVNLRCFADQKRKIDELGGLEACETAYIFNHTPTPGEQSAMADGDKTDG